MSTKQLIRVVLFITGSAGATQQIVSQANAAPSPGSPEQEVRNFMASVAHDVTKEGPRAWLNYFENGPIFFMAVNGQMAFSDGSTAREGTEKFAQTIRQIELRWGDDLRVDALTSRLAVVAVPWREKQIDVAGHTVEEHGYFTALVENQDGRWRFRNAHWSSPVSPSE